MAHILAKAVIEIYGKEVQYAIGPQIDDGCYYDFVLPKPVTQDDFKMIEDKMREIIKRREDWTRKEVTKAEALELFKDQKFKTELINDLPEGEIITIYHTGDDFVDLCRGPHVENSQELMNVSYQIKSVSGAYWRGDEKRDQLSRIYLYAFPSKDELKQHIKLIQEAMERDHKKIGPQLDLFMFDETAPGMPYWLPRGWKMYQALLKYSREIQEKHGYTEIAAPLINNKKLWLISGHWAHYVNNMFMVPGLEGQVKADAEIPGVVENINEPSDEPKNVKIVAGSMIYNRELEDTMAAKPMNCPNAMMTYKRTNHSYKELPIRYSEYDVLHRKEKSGQMNGLFRVQEFRQDDDHTFVMESQIKEEIADVIAIADEIYSTFGVTYRAELSTRPEDFMGDIEVWNRAEKALKEILDEKYGEGGYEINEGDGAFYGPKIDFHVEDCLKRTWQCGTIQLDFQLPQNFDLKYTGADGAEHMPVMIHRVVFGSVERFIGVLTENCAGKFPTWLAPVQVKVLPISDKYFDYSESVLEKLKAAGIRAEIDTRSEKIGYKIREARLQRVPYMLILGQKEEEAGNIAVRSRFLGDEGAKDLDAFIKDVCAEIEGRVMREEAAED